jgi:hypothetical protein
MSETAPPIPGQFAAREPSAALQPSFLKALRAGWLFTWRSQLAWRSLPLKFAALLALPVLIYFTMSTPDAWARRHTILVGPAVEAERMSRVMSRRNITITPAQRDQLKQIYADEFATAEAALRETDSSPAGIGRRQEIVKEGYGRIRDRVRPVLDDRQFERFQNVEDRFMQPALARAREPQWSWTEPFYHWLVDIYFFVILPLNCVRGCGGLIRDELQADTLGFLTTRPLSRARLIIVKYLAQTAWLQIVMLIETLLIFGAGGLRHIPGLGALLPLFLAAQFLAVPAWSALGAFFGLVSKRHMALAIVYGLIVEMGIGRIPTNINTLSLMRHLKTLLAHNDALNHIYDWPGTGVPFSIGALILAAFIFAGLAAVLFTFREYQHTAEMQK